MAVLGVVVALVLRAPSAATDFTSAFRHFRVGRLPWLVPAAALEAASLTSAAMVQRRLLRAGDRAIPLPSLFGLTVAATAVAELVPGGFAPASGWLLEQYHSRDVPFPLAAWSIAAAGFAATTTVLGLLLSGAAIAQVWAPVGLAASGAVLVSGSAAFVAAVHRAALWDRWLIGKRRGRVARAVTRAVESTTRYRATAAGGALVLVLAALNWLLDAGVLVVAFAILGLAVPWRGLLFAYAASQVAGSLSLLPAGLGAVEGGMVGGFLLTGAPAADVLAATLAYRVVANWSVAGVGAAVFAVQTRRWRPSRDPER